MEQLREREIKKNLELSIIIPTYHRIHDLNLCLDSLLIQTIQPVEILIVDDSNTSEIEELILQKKKEFTKIGIELKYIRNTREKSAAIARNVGVQYTFCDIVLFLDSDVILEKKYIEEILRVYQENSNALGVQGYITNNRKFSTLNNFMRRLFFQTHLEKNQCRVLVSTGTTYPYKLDSTISCEWISGSNCSYQKEVFKMFLFDEQLKKYSYYEDIDLSYNIFKKYPNSLFMTPFARLTHTESTEGRRHGEESIYSKEIYRLYFFYKDINHMFINNLIFVWSRLGFILFNFKNTNLKHLISAYLNNLKHLKEIKKGDLDFFKKTFK